MPFPTPSIEALMNFLYTIYYYIREAVKVVLEYTIFQSSPEIAATYSDICTLLITLTAVYILLEFVSTAKRILRVILILAWAMFIVTLFIEGGKLSL